MFEMPAIVKFERDPNKGRALNLVTMSTRIAENVLTVLVISIPCFGVLSPGLS